MSKVIKSSNSKTEWVALGEMTVSEFSQRELKQYRVDQLVSEFDPERLGRVVVNRRGGRYYIIDGQHRVRALQEWYGNGWEQVKIECQAFDGLNEQAEADMFLKLNNTLTVNAWDRFDKAVVAGRPVENAIKKVVEDNGLKITRPNSGGISCVSTLVRVFNRTNGHVLARVLRIVRDSYGETGYEAVVIDGLAHLCQRYNGVLDEQDAQKSLGAARGGIKGLVNRANEINLRTGNSKAMCVAAAAVDIINTGKAPRSGKRLPSWWKVEGEV